MVGCACQKGRKSMQIHTVREGESVFHIARQYDTSALTIIANNALIYPDRLVVGEQLVILRPTRTHTVRGTETLSEIAKRYEIRQSELVRNNPTLLCNPTVHPGQLIALRYAPPKGGMSAGLGYVREGTTVDALSCALPYLSYFVLDACRIREGAEIEWKRPTHLGRIIKERKTPLLRIEAVGSAPTADTVERIAERAIGEGYYGIVLGDGCLAQEERHERDAYLLSVRRRMLGCGLILFVEGDLDSDFGDYADGNILLPGAMWKAGERMGARFDRMAERYECAKTFLGLPCACEDAGSAISYQEMREIAYKYKAVIREEADGEGALSYRRYQNGRGEDRTIRIPSPEYLTRLIGYLGEYGMMGAAVEIDTVPTFLWMLLHTLLGEVDYALSRLTC